MNITSNETSADFPDLDYANTLDKRSKKRFSPLKFRPKYILPVIGSLLLMSLLIVVAITLGNRTETTSDQTKAATNETGVYVGRFKEVATTLSTPVAYFNTDHNKQISARPSTISITNGTVTIKNKAGAIFDNPLKNEPFYRISVTMTDTDTKSAIAYVTGLRELWGTGVSVKGISAGINATTHPFTYFFDHTDHMTGYTKLTADQKKTTDQFWSRFVKRYPHDVSLELYVTPIGTYAVIDRYNTFTFPDDYAGRPVLSPGAINYIVLGKWDSDTASPITFKDLRVTKLDNNVTDTESVNAFFIKKSYQEAYPAAKQKLANKTLSWSEALWMALLLRGYDYYYAAPGTHKAEVTQLAQYALNGTRDSLQPVFEKNVPRYDINKIGSNSLFQQCFDQRPDGWTATRNWPDTISPPNLNKSTLPVPRQKDSWRKIALDNNVGYWEICSFLFGDTVVQINHGFINSISASTLLVLGISDYLDAPLREQYRQAFAPVIDRTSQFIFPKKTDGTYLPDYNLFPDKNGPGNGNWYEGDTGMEEYSWLINLYAGYYSLYYYDNDATTHRADKVLEWLVFLDHHGYSEELVSLRTKFGSTFNWQHLPAPALTFETQTVWSDKNTPPVGMPPALAKAPQRGMMDNHEFHPSANYGIPSAADYAMLVTQKTAGFNLPRLRTNQNAMLNNSFLNMIDLKTLRRKPGTIFRLKDSNSTPISQTDRTDRQVVEGPLNSEGKPNSREGLIGDYYGSEKPGNLEDWANSFIQYHIPLVQSDYKNANEMARNVYYSNYNSTGRLFCSHVGWGSSQYTDKATCLRNDALSGFYDAPLFAMLFNPQSSYPIWNYRRMVNDQVDSVVANTAVMPTAGIELTASNDGLTASKSIDVSTRGTVYLHTDVALSGKSEVRVNGGAPIVVTFNNGKVALPATKLGAPKTYELTVRPAFNTQYNQYSLANSLAYPWSSSVKVTVKEGPVVPPPVSPPSITKEQAYTSQLYRELTGDIPALSDTAYKANLTRVTSNDCVGAVQNIAQLPAFQQRKKSYTDLEYVHMIYRTTLSRNIDTVCTNGWVTSLQNQTQSRESLLSAFYTFPEAQAACKDRRSIAVAIPNSVPTPCPVATPQPDLILSQVSKRAKDGKYKTRVVTSDSQPDTTLGSSKQLGKIYSTPGAGRVALHECYFASWDEYIMITSPSKTQPSDFCQNKTANWSETYKGVVGYVGAAKSTMMSKGLKECYDETNLNHHYALVNAPSDPACSAYATALTPRPTTRESYVYGWVQ